VCAGSVFSMPKPPHHSSGQGESDFDWLYGANPAPTRIISREDLKEYQRTGRKPGRGKAPAPTPKAPKPAKTTGRRRLRPVRIALALVALWVVFLIVVPILAWTRIDRVNTGVSSIADQPGTNYLLVGSDSRKGLSRAESKRLGTGGVGDIGQRTDTIMILHTGSGKPVLMSIPRDSLVPIPGHGTTKINAAFAWGGPKLLIKTIEQNTGLRIDNYIEIGFGGFVRIVDAVGGVTICPKQRMVDPKANLRINKGCQEVDGATALGYSRSRYTMANGDLGRAQHQREVLGAVGKKVKSPWTFINPFRYYGINQAVSSSITVGKGTSPFAMAGFGLAMTRVNGSGGLTCAVPIRDLAVHWDTDRARKLFGLLKEDRTDDITKSMCTPGGLPT
jgi:LCP family protein required for cell wall assembly